VVTKYIVNSIQLKSIEIATILSVTFCPVTHTGSAERSTSLSSTNAYLQNPIALVREAEAVKPGLN